MADLQELKTLGAQPIPGENPGGSSVQYDEDYEAMRVEVGKLDSVEQEPVDWGMIIDTGSDILGKRSKHLLVGMYLTLALLERHEIPGLEAGLTICRDLLKNYWDVFEPPMTRKRGRIEAIFWLAERAGKVIAKYKPTADDKDQLTACQALIKESTDILVERLEHDAPGFGDLQRGVQQHIKDLEAAERAAEAARKRAAERAASGEIDGLASLEDARKALAKVRTTVKQICDYLRKADSSDPAAYRVIRAVTWGAQKELPPNNNGATQIPAVNPELATRMKDLHQKADWANLVEAAETAFGTAIFWLDIHRWTALGLVGQGATHAEACDAVMAELASLVGRLPELATFTFADGTPFASAETLKWLDTEVRARMSGGTPAQAMAGGGDGLPEGLSDAMRDAGKLAAKSNLPAAIKLLQDGASMAGDLRSKFLWRLGLARICLDTGKPMLAAPQLEELESMIDRHNLEVWEPELCLSVYTALLTARRMLLKDQRKVTPELMQKTNALHDRLCRLDAAAALALDGK